MVTTSVSWQLQHFVSVSYSKSIEEYRINKTPDPNVGQVFFLCAVGCFFCARLGGLCGLRGREPLGGLGQERRQSNKKIGAKA